jgi:hypothetical protein
VANIAIRSARRNKESRFLCGLWVRSTPFALMDAIRTVGFVLIE